MELLVDGRPVEAAIGRLDVSVERHVHRVDQLAHPRSSAATRTFATILALLLTLVGACAPALPVPRAEIGDRVFAVEVVDTDATRAQGLIGRASLAPGAGMAFVWDQDTDVGFHMQGVVIALQIAFVASDGTVARIMDMVPCPSAPCPAYSPGSRYRWALEVNAGALAGVREGAHAQLIRR